MPEFNIANPFGGSIPRAANQLTVNGASGFQESRLSLIEGASQASRGGSGFSPMPQLDGFNGNLNLFSGVDPFSQGLPSGFPFMGSLGVAPVGLQATGDGCNDSLGADQGATGGVGADGETITFGGEAGPIAIGELVQAAGGDQEIVATLQKVASDEEGAKALRLALDEGTTFQQGGLEGNVVGLTEYGGGGGPVVTLEDPSSVDTAAHEIAHAASPDMDHELVYEFGHQVATRLGEPTI